MKELTVGTQCSYIGREFKDGALTKTPCEAKHNDRSRGAPQQLVLVKGQPYCQKHAPNRARNR